SDSDTQADLFQHTVNISQSFCSLSLSFWVSHTQTHTYILHTYDMKKSRKSLVKTEPSTEQVAVETSHMVDHLDQIAAKFSNLYWSEDFSDVELVINGAGKFKVHRAVLAMSSDVFRQMFSEGRWQESGLPEVPLTEEESCVDHMNSFLQYFYTGVLSVDAGNLFRCWC
ncbi:hypothetical protein AAFF_G00434830, partial [Aldrovandia affinis]